MAKRYQLNKRREYGAAPRATSFKVLLERFGFWLMFLRASRFRSRDSISLKVSRSAPVPCNPRPTPASIFTTLFAVIHDCPDLVELLTDGNEIVECAEAVILFGSDGPSAVKVGRPLA